MMGWSARLLLVALGVSGACAQAMAETSDCRQPRGPIETDLCMSADYDTADAQLNATYARVTRQLTSWETAGRCDACTGMTARLVDAERHWIAFRDDDCEAVYRLAADGTDRNPARMKCLIDHTRVRTRQLAAQFSVGD